MEAALVQSQILHEERQKLLADEDEMLRRVMEESKKEHEAWVAKQLAEQEKSVQEKSGIAQALLPPGL